MATRVASCNDSLAKREFSWVNKELGGLSGYAAGGRINKEECSAFQGGIVNNTFFYLRISLTCRWGNPVVASEWKHEVLVELL